jgi:hypothetical protein
MNKSAAWRSANSSDSSATPCAYPCRRGLIARRSINLQTTLAVSTKRLSLEGPTLSRSNAFVRLTFNRNSVQALKGLCSLGISICGPKRPENLAQVYPAKFPHRIRPEAEGAEDRAIERTNNTAVEAIVAHENCALYFGRRWLRKNTGWKPLLDYAVASPLRIPGDTSRDGSERSLDSPEKQCSIGFQPVFFAPSSGRFASFRCSSGGCKKIRVENLLSAPIALGQGSTDDDCRKMGRTIDTQHAVLLRSSHKKSNQSRI